MTTTGTGSGRCKLFGLIDGGDLGRRGNAEAFDMRTLASSCKARTGDADGVVGEGGLVGHLSKTACVDAHSCLRRGGWGICAVDR